MKRRSKAIPGFSLTLGYTILYLSLIVLIPLAALVWKTTSLSWVELREILTSDRVIASFQLSFGAAFIAAVVNAIFGLLAAWVLVRYQFPGKKLLDSLVDIPFALPTAVGGICLTTLYAENGWIGSLAAHMGIKIAFTPFGITLALVFIGLPFVIRTIQPILEDLGPELEEAAASLGADRWNTFRRVIFPEIAPAWATGFALAFSRAVGEYGSVVFIAGNMPLKTEITPLLIITKLEQFDYAGATAIAMVMLVISFTILLALNFIQRKYLERAL